MELAGAATEWTAEEEARSLAECVGVPAAGDWPERAAASAKNRTSGQRSDPLLAHTVCHCPRIRDLRELRALLRPGPR